MFPDTELLRMDADTVTASNSHEQLLRRFEEEKIPILLGTQMVTKGLDFENVTLVGVVDADMSLYVDNFRAAETTFSLITQVVGRAGRGAAIDGRGWEAAVADQDGVGRCIGPAQDQRVGRVDGRDEQVHRLPRGGAIAGSGDWPHGDLTLVAVALDDDLAGRVDRR